MATARETAGSIGRLPAALTTAPGYREIRFPKALAITLTPRLRHRPARAHQPARRRQTPPDPGLRTILIPHLHLAPNSVSLAAV